MTLTITFATITVVALLLSGLLGSVESALAPISRARVEGMVKDETPGADALLRVVENRANHINTLVLLRTVLDVMAAVSAAMLAMDVIASDAWAIAVAVIVVTLLQFSIIGVFALFIGSAITYPLAVMLLTAGLFLSRGEEDAGD